MKILVIIEKSPTKTSFFEHLICILGYLSDCQIDLYFHRTAHQHMLDPRWQALPHHIYVCPSYIGELPESTTALTIPALSQKIRAADKVLRV